MKVSQILKVMDKNKIDICICDTNKYVNIEDSILYEGLVKGVLKNNPVNNCPVRKIYLVADVVIIEVKKIY